MKEYKEIYKKLEQKLNLYLKRIYVLTFNGYSFYWLYKLIWVTENVTWEHWFLWFFTTTGMHLFVLDNNDIFIKIKKKGD